METNINQEEKKNMEFEKKSENPVESKSPEKTFAENLSETVNSRSFKIALGILFLLVLLAGVFNVGVAVGYRKAKFSYSWGENYHMNFSGPKGGFLEQLPPPLQIKDEFTNAHGTAGSLIKAENGQLIIKGNDNVEKTIIVNRGTAILNGRQNIGVADLKAGNLIVSIGRPNDAGQIEAVLIRVFNSQ